MRLIPHILKDNYYADDYAVLHITRWLSGHILENAMLPQCCRLALYHQAAWNCTCVRVRVSCVRACVYECA